MEVPDAGEEKGPRDVGEEQEEEEEEAEEEEEDPLEAELRRAVAAVEAPPRDDAAGWGAMAR